MSRILESLNKAEKERSALRTQGDGHGPPAGPRRPQSAYFWLSMLLLLVLMAAIVGGFLLLQERLYGVAPADWLAAALPDVLVEALGLERR